MASMCSHLVVGFIALGSSLLSTDVCTLTQIGNNLQAAKSRLVLQSLHAWQNNTTHTIGTAPITCCSPQPQVVFLLEARINSLMRIGFRSTVHEANKGMAQEKTSN
jgi:hypothetical protein